MRLQLAISAFSNLLELWCFWDSSRLAFLLASHFGFEIVGEGSEVRFLRISSRFVKLILSQPPAIGCHAFGIESHARPAVADM